MPVLIYKSLSQKVQDFVNAWLAANDPALFMIDLVTKKVISTELVDLPALGFSTKSHRDVPIGFPEREPSPEGRESLQIFDTEGVLYLEFDRQELPRDLQKLDGELWLFEIMEEDFLVKIKPLADALFDEFKINIVIRPEAAKDNDPKHVTERLANGIVYCPIIPRAVPSPKEI